MPPRKRPAAAAAAAAEDGDADASTSAPKKKQRGAGVKKEVKTKERKKEEVKKKEAKSVVEKRASRYIASPNAQTLERIERAFSHRLYLIDKAVVGEPEAPEACEFVVLGNTGNVYTVKVQKKPQCTCPDFMRGHLCKHYLFVMLRVLKLKTDDPRIWQKALLSSELSELLTNPAVGDGVRASHTVIARFQEITGRKVSGELGTSQEDNSSKGVQRPVEGDCPVCYEPLVSTTKKKSEPVVFCKSCGNNVHRECFELWSKSKGKGKVTCIYCRAVWVDESVSLSVPSKEGRGGFGAEYVNLAAYSETHAGAETSLESLYPNSHEFIRRRRR